MLLKKLRITQYQVDAFTAEVFAGNPAAAVVAATGGGSVWAGDAGDGGRLELGGLSHVIASREPASRLMDPGRHE